MLKKYIHYGHTDFDINKFSKIITHQYLTKPQGGLWASDIKAKFGWYDWCLENNFGKCDINNSFIFTLSDNAKVLYIDNVKILNGLQKCKYELSNIWVSLDFEKLAEIYDAIEVNISYDFDLYYKLYGWDCDSILIMNPDVIRVCK